MKSSYLRNIDRSSLYILMTRSAATFRCIHLMASHPAWVGLDSATFPERTGFGVAESVLHDEQGRIGRAIQTVLIEAL